MFVIFVANLLLLKESRAQIGLAEPDVNPLNLFGAEGSDPKPSSLRDLARAAVPQPGILDRVRAVAGNHAGARNLQYLDAHVL